MNISRLQTRLLRAIREEDLDQVNSLLHAGLRPVRSRQLFARSESPLVLAASVRSLSLLQILLAHGAPADEIGLFGYTALQVACRYGDLMIADILLDHGAKVNSYRHRPSALALAAFSGNVELVQILLRQGADPNHIWIGGIASAIRINKKVLQTLIEASEEVPEEIFRLTYNCGK